MFFLLTILLSKLIKIVLSGMLKNKTMIWHSKITGYVAKPKANPFINVPNITITNISINNNEKET